MDAVFCFITQSHFCVDLREVQPTWIDCTVKERAKRMFFKIRLLYFSKTVDYVLSCVTKCEYPSSRCSLISSIQAAPHTHTSTCHCTIMKSQHIYLTNGRFAWLNRAPVEKNEVAIVDNYKCFEKPGKVRCVTRLWWWWWW